MPPARRPFFRSARSTPLLIALTLACSACSSGPATTGTPAELIEKGWDNYRLSEWGTSERFFKAAITQLNDAATAPGGETAFNRKLLVNAHYGLGLIYSLGRHTEQTADAETEFRQVISLDQDPDKSMAAWAALALVRDRQFPANPDTPIDSAGQIQGYSDVIAAYPNAPAAEDAFIYRANLQLEDSAPEKIAAVVTTIDDYLRAHPDTHARATLLTLQANAFITLKHYKQSFAALEQAFEHKEFDTNNPNTTKAWDYYALGLSAEFDLGDFAAARSYYQKFLAEYPDDQKAFVVQLELRRMAEIEARIKSGLPVEQAVQGMPTPIGPATQPAGGAS